MKDGDARVNAACAHLANERVRACMSAVAEEIERSEGETIYGRREDASATRNDTRERARLTRELEKERAQRSELENAAEMREVTWAKEREDFVSKINDAETCRAEAEAETFRLRDEIERIETVIRQEEGVVRLRLEAEHEVRVGRLATELDRVRGELENCAEELRRERERDSATVHELDRVRDELIGRLREEMKTALASIDCVSEAVRAVSKDLRGETPAARRVSQCVPSKRERAFVVDTRSPSSSTSSSSRTHAMDHHGVALSRSASGRSSGAHAAPTPGAQRGEPSAQRRFNAAASSFGRSAQRSRGNRERAQVV